MIWSNEWTFSHLTKLHKHQPTLVNNALSEMLQNNSELAWSLVVSAYLDEEINLGKAAELLDSSEVSLRKKFLELGIPLRIGSETQTDAQAEVNALKEWFEESA